MDKLFVVPFGLKRDSLLALGLDPHPSSQKLPIITLRSCLDITVWLLSVMINHAVKIYLRWP